MKVCSKCGKEKPANFDSFAKRKKSKDGLDSWCRDCHNASAKRYADERRADPVWQQEYLKEKSARSKILYRKDSEKAKERARNWREKNITRALANCKNWNNFLRMEALRHYSNGDYTCRCCGEETIQFLCIDHIDGGGAQHAKQLKKEGKGLYKWLKDNNYPPGFQTLCHNCNMSKGFYGFCPHQEDGSKHKDWSSQESTDEARS